jgi:hypothetical protein
MLRFILLGSAAVAMGLTAGWIFVAKTPVARSSTPPVDIARAHAFRPAPLPAPPLTAKPASDVPDATSEPSGSGHSARKRKQLKSKLAAASAKPGLRTSKCDDDDDDEC